MEIRKVRNEQDEKEDIILCKVSEKDIAGGVFVVPDNITIIGERAFAGNLEISALYANNVEEIEKEAFEDCENLHFVQFGSKLKKIGAFAFRNTKIGSAKIPEETMVENFAFDPDVIITKSHTEEEKQQGQSEKSNANDIKTDLEPTI